MRVFAWILFVSIATPLWGQDKPPVAPQAGPDVEVQFADGSNVKLTLLEGKIDVATRYGKLTVPLNEVRRIDLGIRYPEGTLKKIQDALVRLGDGDYKKREQASAELLALRELAYPHVRRAAANSTTPEATKRARALLEELRSRIPEEKLTLKDHDTISTVDFPIAGQIEATTFKARSPLLGDVEVKLVQARSIRWTGSSGDATLTLDAAKHGGPAENWLDTGVEVSGERISIQASGTVDVMPQNPGQFLASPDGIAADVGGFGGPGAGGPGGGPPVRVGRPGALVGRIGTGQPFLIGSRYDNTPSGNGKLYLRLEPSPWRVAPTGSFTIKISTGK